ncbi:MAG: ribosome biogenesis GTPase Der [Deltaproteobacteria bacterium]
MMPIVAIVGRPNVGKSTLFNRLAGRRKAVVSDEPGATRDLNYAEIQEKDCSFTLVDTGGFMADAVDEISGEVKQQAGLAIEDADLTVFLMDCRSGPTPEDVELLSMLRDSGKSVVYALNKVDSSRQEELVGEFYNRLGIKDVVLISAEHGRGINDLSDAISARLPRQQALNEGENGADKAVAIAIVGRPNAGKSTLLNRIVGRKRAITSSIAGTTRDPVDTAIELDGRRYVFVDTAGIRKKTRISNKTEIYCVIAAIKAIERCDCALLVLNAIEGLAEQDEKIAGLIEGKFKCCIIVVNKWDAIEKDGNTAKFVEEEIRRRLPFLSFAPVLFVSALKGKRVSDITGLIDSIVEKSRQRFSTSELNKALEGITRRSAPPSYRGKEVKFYYMTQTGVSPPEFLIFSNIPHGIKESYRRYMIKGLRDGLGLASAPIRVIFKKRS